MKVEIPSCFTLAKLILKKKELNFYKVKFIYLFSKVNNPRNPSILESCQIQKIKQKNLSDRLRPCLRQMHIHSLTDP